MKLNLGCGFKKKAGFVNIDSSEGAGADLVFDLVKGVWPYDDNSVDEVHFDFSLEEMGESKKDLFFVFKELYRVCQDKAVIKILFTHPFHDQFALNPLGVHRLSPQFFQLLSIQQNMNLIANNRNDTCLALQLNVDFVVKNYKLLLTQEVYDLLEKKIITEDDVRHKMNFERNICQGVELELTVQKRRD